MFLKYEAVFKRDNSRGGAELRPQNNQPTAKIVDRMSTTCPVRPLRKGVAGEQGRTTGLVGVLYRRPIQSRLHTLRSSIANPLDPTTAGAMRTLVSLLSNGARRPGPRGSTMHPRELEGAFGEGQVSSGAGLLA